MSKGSQPRPHDRNKFNKNFDLIFNKKKEKKMKAKELEKLFKDKLQKDGINKEWLDTHFEVIGLDTEDNQEEAGNDNA